MNLAVETEIDGSCSNTRNPACKPNSHHFGLQGVSREHAAIRTLIQSDSSAAPAGREASGADELLQIGFLSYCTAGCASRCSFLRVSEKIQPRIKCNWCPLLYRTLFYLPIGDVALQKTLSDPAATLVTSRTFEDRVGLWSYCFNMQILLD